MKNLKFEFLLLGLVAILFITLPSCEKVEPIIDPCSGVSCLNGGTCVSGDCDCPDGFSGTTCEIEDKCVTQAVDCQNGGTCDDGICSCPTGYSGTLCDTHCSTEIVGTYTATNTSNSCFAASFEIRKTSDTLAEVDMVDTPAGGFGTILFTGTINADCTSITLDPSDPTPSGFQGISDGTIDINGNTITVNLTAKAGDTCSAEATK